MEQKIKYIINSLALMAVAQILTIVYSAYQIYKTHLQFSGVEGASTLNMLDALGGHSTFVMIFAAVSANFFKEGKPFAWILAVTTCLFALPTYGFPAALIGLLYLADREVRNEYWEKLNIQF